MLLQGSIERAVDARNALLQRLFPTSLLAAYGAQLALSVALVLLAAAAVQLVAPRAAGGGVTWVMVGGRRSRSCATSP